MDNIVFKGLSSELHFISGFLILHLTCQIRFFPKIFFMALFSLIITYIVKMLAYKSKSLFMYVKHCALCLSAFCQPWMAVYPRFTFGSILRTILP